MAVRGRVEFTRLRRETEEGLEGWVKDSAGNVRNRKQRRRERQS